MKGPRPPVPPRIRTNAINGANDHQRNRVTHANSTESGTSSNWASTNQPLAVVLIATPLDLSSLIVAHPPPP